MEGKKCRFLVLDPDLIPALQESLGKYGLVEGMQLDPDVTMVLGRKATFMVPELTTFAPVSLNRIQQMENPKHEKQRKKVPKANKPKRSRSNPAA